MKPLAIYWLILAVVFICLMIYRWWRNTKINEETTEIFENKRKKELKYLIENIEKRKNHKLADEDGFWELISFTKQMSKGNYKNQLGLLRDKFNKMSENEIVEMDNLMSQLYRKGFNWEMLGVSSIIYKDMNPNHLFSLISWIISRGGAFYYDSLANVNFMLKEEYVGYTELRITDVLDEAYYYKTKKFMPESNMDDFQLEGQEWSMNDLPKRFPKIWDKYA